jgi:DNA-directed RNA polymerase subunit K/omega
MEENQGKQVVRRSSFYCVEDLLRKSGGGQFSLVRVAMLRALELESGKPSLIETRPSDKVVTTVFEEILQGKVALKK